MILLCINLFKTTITFSVLDPNGIDYDYDEIFQVLTNAFIPYFNKISRIKDCDVIYSSQIEQGSVYNNLNIPFPIPNKDGDWYVVKKNKFLSKDDIKMYKVWEEANILIHKQTGHILDYFKADKIHGFCAIICDYIQNSKDPPVYVMAQVFLMKNKLEFYDEHLSKFLKKVMKTPKNQELLNQFLEQK